MRKTELNFYERQIAYFEQYRYGSMALTMTFQSCYGSIAAMFGLKIESTVALLFCALITMICNAVMIAVAPAKWCVNTLIISLIINTIIIVYALLQ